MTDLGITAATGGESYSVRHEPKVSKGKVFIPLPVQLFGADALEGVGRTLFSEKIVKPVSLLGYYSCFGLEKCGAIIEGVVDVLIREEAVEAATDLGEIAAEERFKEAASNQAIAAAGVQSAVSYVPIVGPTVAVGMRVADAIAQENLKVGISNVQIGKAATDWGIRLLFPIVRSSIKGATRYIVTLPAMLGKGFKVISENPAFVKETFIQAADHIRGSVWKLENVTQRFFNKAALYAEREKNQLPIETLRTLPPLSVAEFKNMTKEERETICFLIHQSETIKLPWKERRKQLAVIKKLAVRERKDLDETIEKIVTSYNRLSDRDINKLTPLQYEGLSLQEKLKITQLIKKYTVTTHDRQELKRYQNALEREEPLIDKKRIELRLIQKFNKLSPHEQASVLDISRNEISDLSNEEQCALVDFLMTRVSKNEEKNSVRDEKELEQIRKKIHAHNACSSEEYKKIAKCFKKYLTDQEKSAIRRLLHEQVIVSDGTPEELESSIKELEQKLSERVQLGDASDEDALLIEDLVESLAYLKELQRTAEIEDAIESIPSEVGKPLIEQEYVEKIGSQVETEGNVYKAFDLVGALGEATLSTAGKVVSAPIQAIGFAHHPSVVQANLRATAVFLEHCQMIPQALGALSGAIGWLGYTNVAGVSDVLGSWAQAASSKVLGISDYTIDTLLTMEKQSIGALNTLSEFEKNTWNNYVQPLLELMKTAAVNRPLAEGLVPLMNRMQVLEDKYMQSKELLGEHTVGVQREIAELGRQFQDVIQQYHDQSAGDIIAFDYQHVLHVVRERCALPEDSPEFLEQLFSEMQKQTVTYLEGITKAIPKQGWWFWQTPTMNAPDKGLYDVFNMQKSSPLLDPLVDWSNMTPAGAAQDVVQMVDQIRGLSQDKENVEVLLEQAEEARDILFEMKKSWQGWFAVSYGISKEAVEGIETLHATLQEASDNAIYTASLVQKGAGLQLEAARQQANIATQYGTSTALHKVAAAADSSKWTYVGGAFRLAGAGLDYMSGRLATRILCRFSARVLRNATPQIAAYAQPFWYGLARAVTFAGEDLGKGVHGVFQGIGAAAQSGVNLAIKAEHYLTTGEPYIDALRISNYKRLTKGEQEHILYLVLQSNHVDQITRKLAYELSIDEEDLNEVMQENRGKYNDRVIELLLVGFDSLSEQEKMFLSPASFMSLDRTMQQRAISIIQEYETITLEEASDPVHIVEKFNRLLDKEQKELFRISIDDFLQLSNEEQENILFTVIHSREYRQLKYKDLSDKEAARRQIDDFIRSQESGVTKKELKQLLALSSDVTHQDGLLTPAKLQEMGPEKVEHIYSILEDLGKFYSLDEHHQKIVTSLQSKSRDPFVQKLQKQAIPILVNLYNATLLPRQKEFLTLLTPNEVRSLVPQEKIELIDFLLNTLPSQKDFIDLTTSKIQSLTPQEKIRLIDFLLKSTLGLSEEEKQAFLSDRNDLQSGEVLSSERDDAIRKRFMFLRSSLALSEEEKAMFLSDQNDLKMGKALSLERSNAMLERFNMLPGTEKMQWRQVFQSARKTLEETKADITAEKDAAIRRIRVLKKHVDDLEVQSEKADVPTYISLQVKQNEVLREIADLQKDVIGYEKALERIKDGKPLEGVSLEAVEGHKIEITEGPKIENTISQLFSEDALDNKDRLTENLVTMTLEPMIERAPSDAIENYVEYCQKELLRLNDIEKQSQRDQQKIDRSKKVLTKQTEMLNTHLVREEIRSLEEEFIEEKASLEELLENNPMTDIDEQLYKLEGIITKMQEAFQGKNVPSEKVKEFIEIYENYRQQIKTLEVKQKQEVIRHQEAIYAKEIEAIDVTNFDKVLLACSRFFTVIQNWLSSDKAAVGLEKEFIEETKSRLDQLVLQKESLARQEKVKRLEIELIQQNRELEEAQSRSQVEQSLEKLKKTRASLRSFQPEVAQDIEQKAREKIEQLEKEKNVWSGIVSFFRNLFGWGR